MLTIKVPLKDAQRVKRELMETDRFQAGYRIQKDEEHLYFPLKERFETPYAIEERELEPLAEQPQTLKDALRGKLPAEVLERLKTAYDQVGAIAILEIDEDLKEHDSIIGQTLLETNPKIRTALAKDSSHEGTYRTQRMRHLAGEDTRVGLHKENGVALAVDVEEVYFSSRLSTERKRIAGLVKPNERVLVMFSGCGPYTCVLAKNTEASAVVGVEINPRGHQLAQENIRRNKLRNAQTYCGDVRNVVPGLGSFERILMPLPKSAENFLDVALSAAAQKATIHFYAFLHEDEYAQAHGWIREACEAAGRTCELVETVRCGQQAPHVYRFCVDFVTNR